MKNYIKKVPIIGKIVTNVYRNWIMKPKEFKGSNQYWKERYKLGGNSGEGSYGALAEFKADVINDFVKKERINSVIEFGYGDGNQLLYSEYPSYIGFDISKTAMELCKKKFKIDKTKKFLLMEDYNNENAELGISLDVIYHLIEDEIYSNYMSKLFNSSTKFVIIYSSNTDVQNQLQERHIKHRKFSDWILINFPGWQLINHIPNKYSTIQENEISSFADFYFYKKI